MGMLAMKMKDRELSQSISKTKLGNCRILKMEIKKTCQDVPRLFVSVNVYMLEVSDSIICRDSLRLEEEVGSSGTHL